MGRVRFTESRVLSLECPAGELYGLHWDDGCLHLGLRVSAEGRRSYVFQSRVHGRVLRMTIGDARAWSLGQARSEARRLTTLVDRGIDPRQEAEQQRLEAEAAQAKARRGSVLVGEAWQVYLATCQAKWSERHCRDHEKLAQPGGTPRRRAEGLTKPGPLASLMALKVSELTAEQLAQWLEGEAARRPTSAAHSFRLLRGFVNWTHDTPAYKGLVPADACSSRTVLDVVPESRTKEGDCLQREQLPAWFRAVRELGEHNPVIAAYLQGLLLTGARREELAELQWAHVDFTWRSLTLRDKVDGQRVIPLTPHMAELLKPLPRLNAFIFSADSKSGHIVSPSIAHERALERAGLPHVSLHGLRRSFGTLSEWCEMPAGIVAQIQGHKPSAIAEKHYRRRPLDLLRLWHTRLETWFLEQAGVLESSAPCPFCGSADGPRHKVTESLAGAGLSERAAQE
jgi:integrase